MKKFVAGFLTCFILMIGVAYAATSLKADIAPFKIYVDGSEFKPDPAPVVINDRTYLPLRAMGDALGVPVNWNESKRQVEVGKAPADVKPTPTPIPTPGNVTLGRNEFLSRYNAYSPYDFKISVLGKVGEKTDDGDPYEVWQFKFENITNTDKTLQIESLGWNQGTTYTTAPIKGYTHITRKTLKPGETFTGIAVLGTKYKGNQPKVMFSYEAGQLFYEE